MSGMTIGILVQDHLCAAARIDTVATRHGVRRSARCGQSPKSDAVPVTMRKRAAADTGLSEEKAINEG
jgi:hypothetical protein